MNHLDQKLHERGILEPARWMNWQPHQYGWGYDVFDVLTGQPLPAKHWKNADKNAQDGHKYRWLPSKPAGAKYYPARDLLTAIAAASGVVYIAAGQPDTLAYIAAGIHNVFSWFDGEASVPATLAADLRAWGVRRVIYAPDNDKTGRKSFDKVAEKLAGSGIHLDGLSFAAYEPKFDINKLWELVQFDPAAFTAALADLPALDLPAPTPAPVIVHRNGNSGGRLDREALKAAIYARLMNDWHWKRSGEEYIAGRVIVRGDKKPSGGYHIASGTFRDFTTGDPLKLLEFAEYIGFRLDDYRTPDPPRPDRRIELGRAANIPNPPRPKPAPIVQPEAAPRRFSDAVILEIATTFTPGTAMLTRLADELNAAGKLPAFCRADLFRLIQEAGYSMNTNTFNTAYKWFVELNCQKSHRNKREGLPYDFFDILPHQERITRLKAAIMTRLIKAAYPESSLAAALIEFSPRMLTDALDPGEDTAAIAGVLNQVLPLPERHRERSASLYKDCEKKYYAIVKTLTDGSITRLDPADLPERARSNPNAYLDVLRLERVKSRDGQQVSGKQRSALIGIHDPRQRNRKLRALGIICHDVTLHREVDSIAAIDREARRNCAHPLRLYAVNRAGDETAAASADSARAADFISTQRSAGYRVYVKLQAASRIEISTPPEREPVTHQPEILRFSAEHKPAAPREDRPDEIPGRYTERWLKFHILRRLKRDERGFYTNPATGEVIPNDLTGSLAELIEALTGYRLTQRQEQTA